MLWYSACGRLIKTDIQYNQNRVLSSENFLLSEQTFTLKIQEKNILAKNITSGLLMDFKTTISTYIILWSWSGSFGCRRIYNLTSRHISYWEQERYIIKIYISDRYDRSLQQLNCYSTTVLYGKNGFSHLSAIVTLSKQTLKSEVYKSVICSSKNCHITE